MRHIVGTAGAMVIRSRSSVARNRSGANAGSNTTLPCPPTNGSTTLTQAANDGCITTSVASFALTVP